MTQPARPPLDRRVLAILASWGVAVLVLVALVSWWVQRNQDEALDRDRMLQAQQTRAICQIVGVIISGPPPVAGPEGDRARVVLRGAQDFHRSARCGELLAEPAGDPVG